MPEPKKDESQDAFVSRCIQHVMNKESVSDTRHAAAKCHGIYKQFRQNAEKKARDKANKN